jgi:hypothetical protein
LSTYPQLGPVGPVGNRDVIHKSTGQRGLKSSQVTHRFCGRAINWEAVARKWRSETLFGENRGE